MNEEFKKNFIKWLLCCGSIVILYLMFSDIGLIFAAAFIAIVIKFYK